MRKTFSFMLLMSGLLGLMPAVQAQEYPNKLIRIVVPFPSGDGSDRVARILSEELRVKWGQPVIVDNRPGGGGNLGADLVAKAPPDGYTLMVTPQFTLVINKSLYRNLSYDPNVFVPVSIIGSGDLVLLTQAKLPVTNLQELIAHAKAKRGSLNYASPGAGSMGHLIAEYFKSKIDADITHVPYKGAFPALMDLIGGQVDMMFIAVGPSVQHVRAGKVRALGVTGPKRNGALPQVPLLSESMSDFVFTYWFGMVASPGTPAAIADKISAVVREVLKKPEVAQQLAALNLEVVGSTPENMYEVMRSERERWAAIVRASGATAD